MKTINKNISVIFFVLFFILNSYLAFSQTETLVWHSRYAGPSNAADSVTAICSNSNGNIFVTGFSVVPSVYHYIVTISYSPSNGDSTWVSRYSGVGTSNDFPYAITADNNACYVTGYTFNSSNNRDIITLKYNVSNGVQQWVKTYNGPGGGGDYGEAITVDNNGNVYTAGRTDNGGAQKMIVIKYDASGNVASGWPMIYTGTLSGLFDEVHAIKVDATGNVYVTGVSRTGGVGTDDYLTLKINSGGAVQWAKKYNGSLNGEDNAIALVLDASASFVFVSGYATLYGANQNYMTIKYNAGTGDSLAAATYNGPGGATDIVTAMTIDPSNNIYVAGYSWGGSIFNFATIKYNTNLGQVWLARSTNSGNSYSTNGIAFSQGSVYVSGTIQNSPNGYDFLTCRYDATTGASKWAITENGTSNGNDWGSGLAVVDSNQIFVTGSANFGTLDFYTVRYQEPVSVRPISNKVPASFSLSQNYPNPFNPETAIRFDIAKSGPVMLKVYDILGREVSTLVDQHMLPGTYDVRWNAGGVSSGIYFYKLITPGVNLTKKMVLNK